MESTEQSIEHRARELFETDTRGLALAAVVTWTGFEPGSPIARAYRESAAREIARECRPRLVLIRSLES